MSLTPQKQQQNGYFALTFSPDRGLNDIIWNKTSAILGRSDTKCSLKDNFLGIGPFKTISREHGVISWNKHKGCWDLKVLGKRGIYSNAVKLEKNQILSLSMDKPTPIKMGESKFYFCPSAPPFLTEQSK